MHGIKNHLESFTGKRFFVPSRIFPSGNRLLNVQRAFTRHSYIPSVVGLFDCTHILIIFPGEDNV